MPACPHCGGDLDPAPALPDPPYDDAQDHDPCTTCKKTGRDPVNPALPCPDCEGSGWL